MINLPSWMFLSSFEKFRKDMLQQFKITNLLHLGRGIFGSDFGSVAFTLEKGGNIEESGVYRRLFEEHVQVRKVKKIKKLFLDKDYGFYTARQRDFGKIPGSPVGYWASAKDIENYSNLEGLSNFADPRQGLATGDNGQFLRYLWEIENKKINSKWFLCSKGGPFRKWYGNLNIVINWSNNGYDLKHFTNSKGRQRSVIRNEKYYFSKKGATWSTISSSKISFRIFEKDWLFESKGSVCFPKNESELFKILGFLNTKVIYRFLGVLSPTLDFHEGPVGRIPFDNKINIDIQKVEKCVSLSKKDWSRYELSHIFLKHPLIDNSNSLSSACQNYLDISISEIISLQNLENDLNKQVIDHYGYNEEINNNVALEDITILQQETSIVDGELVFHKDEIMSQFVSYAVGCMFGRYSLDREGLILANQGEGVADYVRKVTGMWWMVDGEGEWRMDPDKDVYAHYPDLKPGQDAPDSTDQPPSTIHHTPHTTHQAPPTNHQPPITFWPDEDNIIPVLDEEWFEDDIVGRFRAFLRASFGEEHFHDNLAFLEECLGTDIRSWFVKKFYPDHIKRYKKRPIYWLFASPSGAFQALVYLHRYTPDTLNNLLNNYLRVYMDKLKLRLKELEQVEVDPRASAAEKSRARKQMDQYKARLDELETWEREVIYPLASERIALDLDDGVLVNYNKFGKAVEEVRGLNDAKTKKKVRGFDWIDSSAIR